MHRRCYCHRQYNVFKFFGDLILLSLTGGFWLAYIIWRLVRNVNCGRRGCCRRRFSC